MKVLRKAQDKIHTVKSSASSNKRFMANCARLTTDKDNKVFDDRILDRMLELGVSDEILAEKDYADSIGFAQSVYEYAKMEEQLKRFCAPGVPSRQWNRWYKQALSSITSEVKKAHLKMHRYHERGDIEAGLPKKDTHAGFSYFLTGWRLKGEYLDELADKLIPTMQQAKKDGTFGTPIIPGYRTQGSGLYDQDGERTGTYKAKTRFVSIVDIYVIMAEVMFAKPFQEYLARTPWYAGGKSDAELLISIRRRVHKGYHMLTVDYSNYDQSIPYWLIKDAFEVVRASFDDVEFDHVLFDVVVNDFIYKVFLDGHGNLIYADKGVPSGSMFTQIIDTIVNRIMIETFKNSKHEDIESMIIMGDDNLIFSKTPISVEEISSYLFHMFGITANADKCTVTDPGGDPEFLSRIWKEAGVYRNPKILFIKMLYPERFREYDKKGFTPDQIIMSYMEAYPLGMRELLGWDVYEQLNTRRRRENISIREVKRYAMTGFEYYRATYCRPA